MCRTGVGSGVCRRFVGRTLLLFHLLLAGHADALAQHGVELSRKPAAAAAREKLRALLSRTSDGAVIGLAAAECDSGETWFAHQPDMPLKPASVMKLFTTAAALDRFGPDFQYETRVYLRNGELLVLGGGDPGLGDERIAERRATPLHGEFDDWAAKLKLRGVVVLRTIALDDTVFDRRHRCPDWPADQEAAWYQAPVGGLNFNDNCLDAWFDAANGRVTLHTSPSLPPAFLRNEIKAAARHKPIAARTPGRDVFIFRGTAARDDSFKPISAARPTVFFGHALKEALLKRGVALEGQVVRRKLTREALAEAELLDVRATSIEETLWRCNTFSQNMFAECLMKSLAAYRPDGARSGVPGSWDAGVVVLRETLNGMGVDIAGAVFRDGSGLSHSNRASAAQITALLIRMHRHRCGELFKQSLARPGKPGTLRKSKWRAPTLRDSLRAKTGTLSGVRALAGYIQRPDGDELAFAILINGATPKNLRVRVASILASAGADAESP